MDRLQRQNGWAVVNPTAAERVDPTTRDRTEKERHVRTVTFEGRNGVYEVDVWYSGGRLCRLDYTDEGTPVLIALERVGNPVRPNRDGTFRTYVEYRVPDPEGRAPQIIREPTYARATDTLNRAEIIRQIPRGVPDYERLIGRRSDAEAANRQIDDHLYLRQAEAVPPSALRLFAYGWSRLPRAPSPPTEGRPSQRLGCLIELELQAHASPSRPQTRGRPRSGPRRPPRWRDRLASPHG